MSTDPARTVDITEGESVIVDFTYAVKWRETAVPFERRMDKYSRYSFLPQHLEARARRGPRPRPPAGGAGELPAHHSGPTRLCRDPGHARRHCAASVARQARRQLGRAPRVPAC